MSHNTYVKSQCHVSADMRSSYCVITAQKVYKVTSLILQSVTHKQLEQVAQLWQRDRASSAISRKRG